MNPHGRHLFGMVHQLSIERIGDLADNQDSQGDYLLGVEGRERAEDFIRADQVSKLAICHIQCRGFIVPWILQNGIPHPNQLRDNTQDIQMRAIREEEIPQMQHLGQRRRARAHRQHRRKRIQLRLHALGKQVRRQFRLHDLQTPVDEAEATVHAVHRAADVARAFAGDEVVEEGEGFDFAARGVEEGCAEDVHALDVDGRLAHVGVGHCSSVGVVVIVVFVFVFFGDPGGCFDEELHFSSARGRGSRFPALGARRCRRLCILESPCYRVQ